MSEQHGKKYPRFLFLRRGQRGSAEMKVPLGLGENMFSFLIQLGEQTSTLVGDTWRW